MRDHREEARFGAVGGFGLIARIGQRMLGLDPIGHVAADALHLGLLSAAHHDLAPGDPARAVGGLDLLIVDAGAVARERGDALLDHRQRKIRADDLLAGASGQRAERVVGVGDAMLAVVAHDHVALRLDEAAGAFLGFLELPVAVGEILDPFLQLRSSARKTLARPISSPIAPQAAPNSAAEPIANECGSYWPELLAAARNPNAAANDIDSTAAARTMNKNARPPKRRYGFAMMPERTRMSAACPRSRCAPQRRAGARSMPRFVRVVCAILPGNPLRFPSAAARAATMPAIRLTKG